MSSYESSYKGSQLLENEEWLVWKFGGTSVGNSERFYSVSNLIFEQIKKSERKLCVVVSAMSGTTNLLEKCCTEASIHKHLLLSHNNDNNDSKIVYNNDSKIVYNNEKEYFFSFFNKFLKNFKNSRCPNFVNSCVDALIYLFKKVYITEQKHLKILCEICLNHMITCCELIYNDYCNYEYLCYFLKNIRLDAKKIKTILKTIQICGVCPELLKELIMGYGEIWSCQILSSCVQKHIDYERENIILENKNYEKGEKEEERIVWLNAREVITIENEENKKECISHTQNVQVEWKISQCKLKKWMKDTFNITINSYNTKFDEIFIRNVFKRINCDKCKGMNRSHSFLNLETEEKKAEIKIRQKENSQQIDINNVRPCNNNSKKSFIISDDEWENSDNHYKINSDMQKAKKKKLRVFIATGYICSTKDGRESTLKRNGSDYSASIFSALLNAVQLTIWTDVNGIYTSDPRVVKSARCLLNMTYIEAIELAYFGAKVLHPSTIHPCIKINIPIIMRNSLNPTHPGTLISYKSGKIYSPSVSSTPIENLESVPYCHKDDLTCKAFSMIDDIALINLEGTSMIGVCGISSRLFSAIHEANCSVIMISQASSQHSICVGVISSAVEKAKKAIENAFYKEIFYDSTMSVSTMMDCAIVCVVGENMRGCRGIMSCLSTALSNCNVNIIAVCQGCSEYNITFVVHKNDAVTALNAVHNSIFPANNKEYLSNSPCFFEKTSQAEKGKKLEKETNGKKKTKKKKKKSYKEDKTKIIVYLPSLFTDVKFLPIIKQIKQKLINQNDIKLAGYTDGNIFVNEEEDIEYPADYLFSSSLHKNSILIDIKTHVLQYLDVTENEEQKKFLKKWIELNKILINENGIQSYPSQFFGFLFK